MNSTGTRADIQSPRQFSWKNNKSAAEMGAWDTAPLPQPLPGLSLTADLTKTQPKRASFLGSHNRTFSFLEQHFLCYVCSV